MTQWGRWLHRLVRSFCVQRIPDITQVTRCCDCKQEIFAITRGNFLRKLAAVYTEFMQSDSFVHLRLHTTERMNQTNL
jgi:hypothetical protein